jgi:hypothetical protein
LAGKLQELDVRGVPRGIDQSEHPGEGTVADMCNIDLSNGVYGQRPGLYLFGAGSIAPPNASCVGIFEYKHDARYKHSYYDTLINVSHNTSTSRVILSELRRIREASIVDISAPGSYSHGQACAVSGLWRVSNYYGEVQYFPCLVIVSEGNDPLVYYQAFGSGAVAALDAIDGGDSSTTYLTSPPKAKRIAMFKNRTFYGNCSDAKNRIYWTGRDPGLAMPVNVFPATYNMDIGTGNEIVDFAALQDRMYIFCTDGIYQLSGDGAGGMWSVVKISEVGALPDTNAAIDKRGVVYFITGDGICALRDTSVTNISHPRIGKIWDQLRSRLQSYVSTSHSPWLTYNESSDYVAVNIRNSSCVILVYYCSLDAWSRWGSWDLMVPSRPPDDVSYLQFVEAEQLIHTRHFSKSGSMVFGTAYWFSEMKEDYLYDDYAHSSIWGPITISPKSIYWFIDTNDYATQDDSFKTLRYLAVEAEPSGDWEMGIIPRHDGQTIEDAIQEPAASKWNIITDGTSSATHAIGASAATCQFPLATDGPVDVFYLDTMRKITDSATLANSTEAYNIKFAATKDYSGSTYYPGRLLVLQQDVARITSLNMKMGQAVSLLGTDFKLGVSVLSKLGYEIRTIPMNLTGRNFSIWFSNATTTEAAALGKGLKMKGWSLWFIPKKRMRPDAQ